MYHSIAIQMEANPDHAILSLDAANAFNEIKRTAILRFAPSGRIHTTLSSLKVTFLIFGLLGYSPYIPLGYCSNLFSKNSVLILHTIY